MIRWPAESAAKSGGRRGPAESQKAAERAERRPPMLNPFAFRAYLKASRSIVIRAEIYGDAINSTIYGAIVVNK